MLGVGEMFWATWAMTKMAADMAADEILKSCLYAVLVLCLQYSVVSTATVLVVYTRE